MKLHLCALFIVALSTFGYGQECDCKKFRTGKFETAGDGNPTKILRTKKYQYEVAAGIEMKAKVVWLNRCTYKIVPLEIRDVNGGMGSEAVTVKIIETFEHSYLARVTMEGTSLNMLLKVYEQGYLNKD